MISGVCVCVSASQEQTVKTEIKGAGELHYNGAEETGSLGRFEFTYGFIKI